MQRITIEHLGPIQELKMDVERFNLVIGEQATGKSTIAKAIYFFRMIKSTLTDYFYQLFDTASYNQNDSQEGFNKVLKKELKSVFISLFGYSWDLDENLYLKYEYAQDIWIDVKLAGRSSAGRTKKRYISIRYSSGLTKKLEQLEEETLELNKVKNIFESVSLSYASKEKLRNYDKFKNSINEIFNDDKETYYIPAGRSMITLLMNNRSLIVNDNLDLVTRQFMQVIENIYPLFEDGIRNVHKRYPDGDRKFDVTKITELLITDLKGDYRYNSGKGYIVVEGTEKHNEKIPINFASSGQQEVLWLLNQLYVLMLKKEKAFVIIEEPEAHLYPALQNKVIEFISCFANINDSSIFITTHSPYILTSVNTLYCAGKIVNAHPELSKKVYNIIGSNYEINPDEVTALKLNRDKSIQDLIDDEMKELNTEMIDEISDIVNEKYVELFYLVSDIDD